MQNRCLPILFSLALALAGRAYPQDAATQNPLAAATAPPPANSPAPGIDFSFLLDGYGSLNFNDSDTKPNQLRNYDFRGNSGGLSVAKITMEREPAPIGFRLDAGFGETLKWNSSSDRAPEAFRYFEQAYVSLKPGSFHGVEVDFGKFNTPVGAEVIESNANYNYSRSLLFAWGGPCYHTGFRVAVPAGRFTGGLYAVQGWNNVYDNNRGKTFGFSGAYAWKKITWNNTYMAGPEKAGTNQGVRRLYDTNVVLTPTARATSYIEFLYGQEGNPGGRPSRWGGIAGAMQYRTSARTSLAARFEYFKDPDGFTTGAAQNLKEVTLTADYKLMRWLLARAEFRNDWSDRAFFQRGPGLTGRSQPTALLALVAFFGPKR